MSEGSKWLFALWAIASFFGSMYFELTNSLDSIAYMIFSIVFIIGSAIWLFKINNIIKNNNGKEINL